MTVKLVEKCTESNERRNDDVDVCTAFVRHQAALKRFISRFLGNSPHDVEDVAQETFLRAYNAANGRQIERPRSYLFRIAKHVALTQLTRKSRQMTDYIDDLDGSEVFKGGDSAEEELMALQTLRIHCEAVLQLSPKCRRVYLMRKVYGMPHKEIAARLGIAVSTVEKHLIKGVEVCDGYIRAWTEQNHGSLAGKRRAASGGDGRS